MTEKEFFDQMGVHFVGFVGQYGYDRVLSVLGRHVRDFLNGLDNLHEYLKFSYPRMRAPSFICENETRQGKYKIAIIQFEHAQQSFKIFTLYDRIGNFLFKYKELFIQFLQKTFFNQFTERIYML